MLQLFNVVSYNGELFFRRPVYLDYIKEKKTVEFGLFSSGYTPQVIYCGKACLPLSRS